MAKYNYFRSLAACGVLTVLASLSFVNASAQSGTTSMSLTVTGGALTVYGGDSTDNNDLCAPADSGSKGTIADDGTAGSVTCSDAERGFTFTGISVQSTRQTTSTATISDILFEDLTGAGDLTYNVSATVGNLTSGGNSIALGSNPDGDTVDNAGGALTGADIGKVWAELDPTVGTFAAISPTAAKNTTNTAKFAVGATKGTLVSNATPVTLFSSNAAAAAGRYDIDGVTFKYRVPAYVKTGTYTGSMTVTVAAT